MSKIAVIRASLELERLCRSISRKQELTYTGRGANQNITDRETNYIAKSYLQSLEACSQIVQDGTQTGLWDVSILYGAANEDDADRISGVLKSVFTRNTQTPEYLRVVPINNQVAIRAGAWLNNSGKFDCHPLAQVGDGTDRILRYAFRTLMSPHILSAFCHLPQFETPHFFVGPNVNFDHATRTGKRACHKSVYIGNIQNTNGVDLANPYHIRHDDLTRHALIIGMTGSGKTNTVKSILRELWYTHNTPFLVIESAKREYFDIYNTPSVSGRDFSGMSLYTMGTSDERSIPYSINPFQVVGDVSVQTHIDFLLAAFKAAFDLEPPLPQVLEMAIYRIYENRGFSLNLYNENRFNISSYPTLTDLYYKFDEVVNEFGYHQEVSRNVKGALRARIGSLIIGGKGDMLNVRESVPIETLLGKPVVLELEDLGDDCSKAFVIGILLIQLYEYRKSQEFISVEKLDHVLVIEEAHRLLKASNENARDTRAGAVEFFCNMLAEIRSYGQGIIISDQIPTKLASDAMKNTNLKIVHRTVTKEDRDAIGNSMNMTEQQIGYLASLNRGVAAVYAEGDYRPKLVSMSLMKNQTGLPRKTVLQQLKSNAISYDHIQSKKRFAACDFCHDECEYESVLSFAGSVELTEAAKLLENTENSKKVDVLVSQLKKICGRGYARCTYKHKLCICCQVISRANLEKELTMRLVSYVLSRITAE